MGTVSGLSCTVREKWGFKGVPVGYGMYGKVHVATGGNKNETWKEVSQIPEIRSLYSPRVTGENTRGVWRLKTGARGLLRPWLLLASVERQGRAEKRVED